MGRHGHVWYCRSRGQYRITNPMTGKQQPLSPRGTPESPANEAAACAAWERMAAAPPAPPAATPVPTAASAAAAYLAWAEARARLGKMGAGCLAMYRRALAPFTAAFGDRPLAGITTDELEEWAARPRPVHGRPKEPPRPWSSSTQNNYLGVLLCVFLKSKCPITGLDLPPKESRGASVALAPEQFGQVLVAIGTKRQAGDLAALLRALRETGARPGELFGLTAAGVDWSNEVVRLAAHKTRRQTGRDRVIVLTAAALAVLRGQRERHPSGLLFRNQFGGAFTRYSVGKRLKRVGDRLGFRVVAYGCRHAFATEKLLKGVPEVVVAAALGQKGTGMLTKHYSHVSADARAIREAMDRADRRAG